MIQNKVDNRVAIWTLPDDFLKSKKDRTGFIN